MPDPNDLRDLPILQEIGVSLRAAAANEDDQHHQLLIRRSRRRRRLAFSGVSLAAVSAAAVIAIGPGFGGASSVDTADASSALAKVAAVAATQKDEVPAADQFLYVRSVQKNLTATATMDDGPDRDQRLVTKNRELWQSINRPGRLLETQTGAKYLSDRQAQAATTPADSLPTPYAPGGGKIGSIGPAGSYTLGTIKLTASELSTFPTDPEAVYDRLAAGVQGRGASVASQVFTDIGDALGEQAAPARLRGALYRALSRIPGIQLLDRAVDATGRNGTGVALDQGGIRRELIFDPETAELLGSRDVVTAPSKAGVDALDGTEIQSATYLDRTVTDTTERP